MYWPEPFEGLMLRVMELSMAKTIKNTETDSIMPEMQMILTDTGRVSRVSDESLVLLSVFIFKSFYLW